MAAKFFVVLCASAYFVQSIAAASCGCGSGGWNAARAGAEIAAAEIAGAEFGRRGYAAPAYGPSAAAYSYPAFAATSGGIFGVSSASPFAPQGITIVSENSIDGNLEVFGSLPILASVALEGTLPSTGAAGTTYGCGCGDVSISPESLAAAGLSSNQLARAELAGAIAGAELAAINAGARIARPASGCAY